MWRVTIRGWEPLTRSVNTTIPKHVSFPWLFWAILGRSLLNEEPNRKNIALSRAALAPNHHGLEQSAQSFHRVLDSIHITKFVRLFSQVFFFSLLWPAFCIGAQPPGPQRVLVLYSDER